MYTTVAQAHKAVLTYENLIAKCGDIVEIALWVEGTTSRKTKLPYWNNEGNEIMRQLMKLVSNDRNIQQRHH